MDVIKEPMSLVRNDKKYSLDLDSKAPMGDMALEAYPCDIVWKHQKSGRCRALATFQSWSVAIWVLYRIENFFPNSASIDEVTLLRGARRIASGFGVLAEHITVPNIRLSKAAESHAARYIAREGLANFSHRIMLNGKITVVYASGDESAHLSAGFLYCQKKYGEDGNVTEYHVRFRSF
jgi:hypothetical protein